MTRSLLKWWNVGILVWVAILAISYITIRDQGATSTGYNSTKLGILGGIERVQEDLPDSAGKMVPTRTYTTIHWMQLFGEMGISFIAASIISGVIVLRSDD